MAHRRLRSGRPPRLQRHHDPLRPPDRADPQHHRLAGAVRLGASARRSSSTASSGPSRSCSRRIPRTSSTSPATSSSARPTSAAASRSSVRDLTRNDPDKLKPSGGPITRDNTGAEVYCTIFALAESPHTQGVFWAGTDDGLVHLSRGRRQDLAERHPARPAGVGADQHHRALAARGGRRLRRGHPLQARRHHALPLQDDRQRRDLDEDHQRHPGRRVHPRHPRGPEPAGPALRRDRDGDLRLVRRRGQLAAARRQLPGRADPRLRDQGPRAGRRHPRPLVLDPGRPDAAPPAGGGRRGRGCRTDPATPEAARETVRGLRQQAAGWTRRLFRASARASTPTRNASNRTARPSAN